MITRKSINVNLRYVMLDGKPVEVGQYRNDDDETVVIDLDLVAVVDDALGQVTVKAALVALPMTGAGDSSHVVDLRVAGYVDAPSEFIDLTQRLQVVSSDLRVHGFPSCQNVDQLADRVLDVCRQVQVNVLGL